MASGRVARARSSLKDQARRTMRDVRVATANPLLRRVQLAWGLTHGAEWAYFIALEVFAFRVDGSLGVGIVGVMSNLPAALAAPLTAVIGERMRRERLLFMLGVVRSAELCAAALAYSRGAPSEFFYGLLGIDSILSSAVFPAQQGLLPRLARNRVEYSASAAVTVLFETLGGGLGPVVGGVLLATTSLGVVYVFSAALLLSSAFLFLSVRARRAPDAAAAQPPAELPPEDQAKEESAATEQEAPGSLIGDFLDGLRVARGNRAVLLLLALFSIDAFLEGALDVFVIVIALKILKIGAEGVGLLSLVETVGGVAGAVLALRLVARRGLAVRWALLSVLDASPAVLLGVLPHVGVAVVSLLAWEGIATIDEAVGLALLRRVVPANLLSRTLGLEDGAVTLSLAVGSIAAPGIIALLGVRSALIVTGLVLPVIVLLMLPGLRRIDTRGTHPPGSAAGAPLGRS